MAAALVLGRGIASTTRHTLVVESVKMQREGACHARVLPGTATGPAAIVASFARLRWWIVELRTEALDAETAVEHEVRRTGGTGQRASGVASFTVVMALLATELGFEESLWALGMTFASSELPTLGTRNALISSWSAAGVAA